MEIFEKIKKFLENLEQNELIDKFYKFSKDKQKNFIIDIEKLRKRDDVDWNLFTKNFVQKKMNENKLITEANPLTKCSYEEALDDELGKDYLLNREIAPVFLAGGMGSRFSLNSPKGMCEITNVKNKTIFQYFSEKILSCQKKYKRKFFIIFMLSENSFEKIVNFFKKSAFFGLDKDQVLFFKQTNLPLYDENLNWITNKYGNIIKGPDGNGSFFHSIVKSKILDFLKEQNVKYLHILPIDNVLADPFDLKFLSCHVKNNADITIKGVFRKNDEKAGWLTLCDNKPKILEYFRISEKLINQKDDLGNYCFKYIYAGIFLINISYIEKIYSKIKNVNFAYVKKRIKINDIQKNVIKSERLIFDFFDFAQKIDVFLQKREFCFSPLKNATGEQSIETVKKALLHCDREQFKKITGKNVDDKFFELSLDFYYPTNELKRRWQSKDLPDKLYIQDN